MQVQSVAYFINQYGFKRGLTVMHRMRTWHKQKTEKALRDRDAVAALRHTLAVGDLSDNIREMDAMRHQRKAA